jgi:hypothetical protein
MKSQQSTFKVNAKGGLSIITGATKPSLSHSVKPKEDNLGKKEKR